MQDAPEEQFVVRKQYYAYKQFTRFLRPNTTLLQLDDPSVVAGISPDGGQLAVVMVNADAVQPATKAFQMVHGALVPAPVAVNLTDAAHNCEAPAAAAVTDVTPSSFRAVIPPEAILSVVFNLASPPDD